MIKGFVYCLKDPQTGNIFYVGQTIKPLNKRIQDHISDSNRLFSEKDRIISEIIKAKKIPQIDCLEEIEFSDHAKFKKDLCESEKKWIKTLSLSFNIVNITHNPLSRKIKNHSEEKEKLLILLKDVDTPIYKIESDLKMPINTLQKALKGERRLPKKWAIKLKFFVETKQYLVSSKKVILQDATQPTNQVKNLTKPPPKTNYTIDTTKKEKEEDWESLSKTEKLKRFRTGK